MIDTGCGPAGSPPQQRQSGILLHPTSLPGPHGIGDLGSEAENFVRWLEAAGQSLWQVMPLGPAGFGRSPYAAHSAFAGNPLLISLEKLVEHGLLEAGDLNWDANVDPKGVDFETAETFKLERLNHAFERSSRRGDDAVAFEAFCERESYWLDDYSLYMALKEASRGATWFEWEEGLALRRRAALARARHELRTACQRHRFIQFLFSQQWSALKSFANQLGVEIIGDIPIFVSEDSADVWANQEIFCLDEHGRPSVVAGVPPDYFSPTGQRWGNPLYHWDRLAERGFDWWVTRFKATLALVDLVRLDHFRGFLAYYAVPAEHQTAERGKWLPGPGRSLFDELERSLGPLRLMVEDLGEITPEVEQLRDSLGFPGMKVLQFAFGDEASTRPTGHNPFLPHNYPQNCVVYTGTHDNDTTRGWWTTRSESERHAVRRYLGKDDNDIVWDLIRLALGSTADRAIVPLQDVLDLGSEARMNFPGSGFGNWSWRYCRGQLSPAHANRLADLTALYGREAARDREVERLRGGETEIES